MSLKKLNVQELDKKQMQTIEGGSWGIALRAASAVWKVMQETLTDPEKYYGDEVDGALGQVKL